ncbi:MAG: TAXI family TRAP transporter solute-binding subunit [Proteobacteria bacterium]|nr:TAXI family TRAP transporter solute-binding subunit [Pseudomonadota bacterium]MBU1450866.1 TAXI family TRAP transporter solute-binding subunit [Pseudomonadota bacterium]MBU2467233.1 TAXI family TRAP transporter solute-binding subunit [Pseudomonadota bacterium]MBU2519101.1 TAXI family TRAP transporter solute-binding subunit [Pseudomonadota bacterium]
MKGKTVWFLMVATLCAISSMMFCSSPAEAKAPKEVSITTYGVGSQAFVFSAGIAEGVQKAAGIKTRVVPAGNDVGRMLPLRNGEVDFCIVTGATGWFVSHGTGDFASPSWGPQPIRMAWRGGNLFVGFYTRGDSGIKKLSELKGKRVGQIPGSTTINNIIQGGLAFGGLTLKDCVVVRLPSHGAGGKALTQGAIDFYEFGTTGSRPIETAASPHGIYWFNMDPKDKAAWKRFYEYCPWTEEALVTRYAGKEKGIKPFHALTYPYNMWAWDTTPVDTVYAYAKAMWDSYDLYKSRHAELPKWNHENLANVKGCFYPYHEGVVKLLKEKGKWTPAHEKFQKTQLDNEKKRMALWKEAQEEAKAKNIKVGSEQWGQFWWNKLVEKGLLR